MPGAAQPLRAAIPLCIGLLLFLSVLRLLSTADQRASQVKTIATSTSTSTSAENATAHASATAKAMADATAISAADATESATESETSDLAWHAQLPTSVTLVLLAQVVLPVIVYCITFAAGFPYHWCLAATLVAAAPPISGSPSLVILLNGDGALALRWLMLGTALLPITCIPIVSLLFPSQSITIMLRPAMILLALIGCSILLALWVFRVIRPRVQSWSAEALDGASALVLVLMVVGLMSAFHKPSTGWRDVVSMLLLAFAVNIGYQAMGVLGCRMLKQARARATSVGVSFGNRNIALYLTALPAAYMEPLLLFIACYQVPMYLTPLIGDLFYSRLE